MTMFYKSCILRKMPNIYVEGSVVILFCYFVDFLGFCILDKYRFSRGFNLPDSSVIDHVGYF